MTEKKPLHVRCPQCRKQTPWNQNPHRPFCSERCRLIDLGQWADEEYRIAGERVREEDPDNLLDFPEQ